MGIIGRRFVSVLSFVVTIVTFWLSMLLRRKGVVRKQDPGDSVAARLIQEQLKGQIAVYNYYLILSELGKADEWTAE
jgi:hypothetical protein